MINQILFIFLSNPFITSLAIDHIQNVNQNKVCDFERHEHEIGIKGLLGSFKKESSSFYESNNEYDILFLQSRDGERNKQLSIISIHDKIVRHAVFNQSIDDDKKFSINSEEFLLNLSALKLGVHIYNCPGPLAHNYTEALVIRKNGKSFYQLIVHADEPINVNEEKTEILNALNLINMIKRNIEKE
ncbi:MAG: hypothetical protein AAFX87_30240 [Bacteroidota bacterium]